ncbi:MAG: DUF805 domain-containing protein [Chloroflexota bacterium]|nr:DUF805 domain-containing protein [Chloroflexota bacterium]MDE2684635.1 DUF805 domain-containing protein [Chloroflexota bacterium]
MEEMYEEEPRSRPRIGRKGYIKRWLILIAVGVVVGVGQAVAEPLLPADFGGVVSLGVLVFYGLPALIISVAWTMRRFTDAGRDEAWALLLVLPVVNIATAIVAASLPSREDAQAD